VSTASRCPTFAGEGLDVDALARETDGTFISGFIRATKPAAATRCAQVAATRAVGCDIMKRRHLFFARKPARSQMAEGPCEV
jgi:hypothetical protein